MKRRALMAILPLATVVGLLALSPSLIPILAGAPSQSSGAQPSGNPGTAPTNPYPPSPGNGGATGPLTLETIWHSQGPSFGFEGTNYLVVQDRATWDALWARAGVGAPKPPAVDFTTHTVLVAVDGNARTTGYDIQIQSLNLLPNGTVRVSVDLVSPGPGCVVAMMITNPTHMVSIPKTTAPFVFQLTGISRPCH